MLVPAGKRGTENRYGRIVKIFRSEGKSWRHRLQASRTDKTQAETFPYGKSDNLPRFMPHGIKPLGMPAAISFVPVPIDCETLPIGKDRVSIRKPSIPALPPLFSKRITICKQREFRNRNTADIPSPNNCRDGLGIPEATPYLYKQFRFSTAHSGSIPFLNIKYKACKDKLLRKNYFPIPLARMKNIFQFCAAALKFYHAYIRHII